MPHRGLRTQTPLVGFIEPAFVPDAVVTGLAYVEDLGGGIVRTVWYADQRCPYTGEAQKVVAAKLVTPSHQIAPSVRSLIRQTQTSTKDLMIGRS